MDRAIAHIDGFEGRNHLLIDHSRNVAGCARKMAQESRPSDPLFAALGEWAGWIHDMGKYREEFQEYLKGRRGKSSETQHAVFGAAWAWAKRLPKGISLAVLGHHAGLHDLSTAQDRLTSDELNPTSQSRSLEVHLQEDLALKGLALPELCAEFIPRQRGLLRAQPRHELLIRMLFSCLVDADYLDTEKYMQGRSRSPVKLEASELFAKLETHVARLKSKAADNEVNRVRGQLFVACVKEAEREPGFFSLTAPTGSGKTLAMMAFALKHAERRGLRRVIVVLPFLSIIEQNAAIYREILGEEVVVEHHSAVEVESSTRRSNADAHQGVSQDTEQESTDQGLATDKVKLGARLATENWDAPIIVTTAVQFLESLFARKPSRCRKLHNIAGSIVLFDEVQSLPLNLLEPILSMVHDLKADFGCSFLLGSATQPRFGLDAHDLPSGFTNGECHEITPEPKRLFTALRRTRYDLAFRDEGAWSWDTLIERIVEHPRILVVVNFRKQAQDLYNKLLRQELEGIHHLSSTMCAAHRQAVLGKKDTAEEGTIHHILEKTDRPCVLISTQAIEAGVDISFPIVYRHVAPLDAVLQAAGRCNREGECPPTSSGRPGGSVVVFKLDGEPEGPRGFYLEATAMTRLLLVNWPGNPDDLDADPFAFGEYHQSLIKWRDTDQRDIQDLRGQLSFEAVARAFKVIDEAGIGVIVPFGEAREIVERIRRNGVMTYEDRRRLQRYTVNLFPNWISALGGDLIPLVAYGEELLCNEIRYHKALGVNLGELPIDQFTHF